MTESELEGNLYVFFWHFDIFGWFKIDSPFILPVAKSELVPPFSFYWPRWALSYLLTFLEFHSVTMLNSPMQ